MVILAFLPGSGGKSFDVLILFDFGGLDETSSLNKNCRERTIDQTEAGKSALHFRRVLRKNVSSYT